MTADDTVTAKLAEWETLVGGATEGPWLAHTPSEFTDSWIEGPRIMGYRSEVAKRVSDARDAEFIAHARTALPALVAFAEAVLALHKPEGIAPHTICGECAQVWPCPTVRAAEKHLGGAP